ncbi:MAG: VOC family protein [Ilumatobacteraceae bacterium]
MQHDLEAAYLGLEVPDPGALGAFFADVVGLAPGGGNGDVTVWRNDTKVHRLLVAPGTVDDATFVGFEAVDADAFDRTVARLDAFGAVLEVGSTDECSARHVQRLVRTPAPWGVPVEVVLGLEALAAPELPLVPGGFLTDGVGFGHVVFGVMDFDGACRFATEGLGLRRSDWLQTELAPGFELEVQFFHCNARHHTLAFAKLPFEPPQKLHHVMFETNQRDDVGSAFDRAWATDLPIPNGLGTHDNDRMFSFYVESPAGFQVEIGHGARLVTEDWDDDRRYDRISAWGHQRLRSA